ncbi:MAG: type II toxin-antitoxin system PemK/MazF family toxin [bacterium]|nr:type II toxin-antitoxin system PemK/MazF family toxin [bacterium]
MTPRRGEVWWVVLDPRIGEKVRTVRGCVVIGRNSVNQNRRTVVVVPLAATREAHPPITVAVQAGEAAAVIDQIRAVPKPRCLKKVGELPREALERVESALRTVLGLG